MGARIKNYPTLERLEERLLKNNPKIQTGDRGDKDSWETLMDTEPRMQKRDPRDGWLCR